MSALSHAAGMGTFYVNYSSQVNGSILRAYDESILHPEANVDLSWVKQAGHRPYAYLSLVEAAEDASYRSAMKAQHIPLIGRNNQWGSDLIDITDAKWKTLFLDLAEKAAQKGYEGFFLDTVESVEELARRLPKRADEFHRAAIGLIKALHAKFPDKPIISNRGFKIWKEVQSDISAVLAESLFQSFDFKGKTNRAVAVEGSAWLTEQLREVKAAGLQVYVVDYVEPQNSDLAAKTAEQIEQLGFHAFVSTPDLSGEALAPVRLLPRKILALYGSKSEGDEDSIDLAADSGTARFLQMPLEWLGYEVSYLNLNREPFPAGIDAEVAGIVLDPFAKPPVERGSELVDFLLAQKRAGKKILIFGNLPALPDEQMLYLAHELRLGGTRQERLAVRNLKTRLSSALMGYEAELHLSPFHFLDLQAPPNSTVHFSASAADANGKEQAFDAVFTTSWGGVALNPYLFFTRPDFLYMWTIDPFGFLSEALQTPLCPVPDVTTRDGRRIFFSQIDGDGFRAISAVDRTKNAAEVIYDEVLTKYPLPITVSVIESEMIGIVKDEKTNQAPELVEQARKMFALPNVQVGSHTYGHPFCWNPADPQAALYEHQTLELIAPYTITNIDYQREVAGSVEYINKNLCPPGKKVEVLQWSGNCRPPSVAVEWCRKIGIEDINGGDTIISRKDPSLTKVAPKAIQVGDQLQIYCAAQNENVFRDESTSSGIDRGTFLGAFMHVIDTFQRTEKPRRLKPVDIYYHFYSGDSRPGLQALKKVYDWVMEQTFHPMTTASYARMVRDSVATHVFHAGTNRFIVVNDGFLRTFRWASTNLLPDIALSKGVNGYSIQNGALYIHTDGSARVEIVFTTSPSEHLYLDSSSNEVAFTRFSPRSVSFTTRGYRPCQVSFGGARPRGGYSVKINGVESQFTATPEGKINLDLPKEAAVDLVTL